METYPYRGYTRHTQTQSVPHIYLHYKSKKWYLLSLDVATPTLVFCEYKKEEITT